MHCSRLLVLFKYEGDSFSGHGNSLRNLLLAELQLTAKEDDAPAVFFGEMVSSMRMLSDSRARVGLDPNEPSGGHKLDFREGEFHSKKRKSLRTQPEANKTGKGAISWQHIRVSNPSTGYEGIRATSTKDI